MNQGLQHDGAAVVARDDGRDASIQVVDTAAVNVFDGWVGHVQVGPLEQAGAPAK